MNTKILAFVVDTAKDYFSLYKYKDVQISPYVEIAKLPWTPARLKKFKNQINSAFDLDVDYSGTILEVAEDINQKYCRRFWNGIWQPRTEDYQFSGWSIVDRINSENPKAVLDVGCGFNQFKSRIHNLIGIDPYNNCADYMVDILDYNVPNETYDHIIVFGSINFGTLEDVETRMKKVFDLLAKGGKVYMRVNGGEVHKHGMWVDMFPWSFDHALNFANKFGVELVTFKVDSGRFYIEYKK